MRAARKHYRALAFAVLLSTQAAAAELNCNPLKLVVPYPAGASTDVVGRLLAERMGPALKQNCADLFL